MQRDEKILIVENDATLARSIGDRYNCDCATDGWDAIEKLENGAYAAIVIDADVPNQSGYGVLAYLREEVGEELHHVIFMTSSDREEVHRNYGRQLTVVDKADAVDVIARVLAD